jgi:hypothetical protein
VSIVCNCHKYDLATDIHSFRGSPCAPGDVYDTEDDHLKYLKEISANSEYFKLLACLERLPVGAMFKTIFVYYY